MYNGSTCERKFELSEILTKLLNPREGEWMIFGRKNIINFLIKKKNINFLLYEQSNAF